MAGRGIRRSSLTLSQRWDPKVVLIEFKDDLLPIAFFPLDTLPRIEMPKKTDDDADSVASVTDSIFSVQTASEIWDDVPMGPPDAILGIAQSYRQCEDPRKVNVCVGAYRDEEGKPYVLPSVRTAERMLWEEIEIKEYLPIEGDHDFISKAMYFAYGQEMVLDNLAAVQTLSGTGACAVGGQFLAQFWPNHPIFVPDPTWGNHIAIFKRCGLDVNRYRYYDRKNNRLDIDGFLEDITNKAPNGSIILLHACAHNPTGCDPTIEQWKQIISVISSKQHIAFFDAAYQGFASGNAEMDAQPFRYAVSQHYVPIILAQSFAKNFGLYGERVGTLSVVCGDNDQKERILSELRCIIRPLYSSPPRHGSSIVKTILGNDELKAQCYEECAGMARRIRTMRTRLVRALKDAGSTHDWSHILRQIGMFAFTGLSEEMCSGLTNDWAIFLTTNGRISMAGLNESNVEYIANSIYAVSYGKSITL
jgi:aspartate aminotransferase